MFLGFQEIYKLSHADPVRNVISVKKSDSLPPCVDCRFRHRWIPILFVRPQPKLVLGDMDLAKVETIHILILECFNNLRRDFSEVCNAGPRGSAGFLQRIQV